jgi:protocatechuate 3,4-dioxygenase beta subunit
MKCVSAAAVALAFAASLVALVAQESPTRQGARVSGVVSAADSGRPLEGALVELTHDSPGKSNKLQATTGPDGSFEFTNLAAGTFILAAGAPRYDQATYRRSQAANAPVRHTLEAGQQVTASIVLLRLGSISGRIFDPFGDPVPGIGVFALEKRDVAGNLRLVRAGRLSPPRLTDDLGQFRLSGLTAGEYYVLALSGGLTASPSFNIFAEVGGFLPTYYPGTPSVADARRVPLGVGQDVSGLTLTVIPSTMYRVSGTVVDSKGEPLASAFVSIVPVDGPGLNATIAGRTQAFADGTFALSRVPPGTYVVQGRTSITTSAVPGEYGWATVTVGQSDVRDVRVITYGPSTLKGRFVFEGEQPLRFVPPTGLQFDMVGVDVETESLVPMSSAPVSLRLINDGRFEIGGLWGRRLLRVRTARDVVVGITLDGKDVTETPIEFNGRDRVGVEVVLSRRSAIVVGKVSDADNKPVPGCRVILFAADPARWTPHSRFVMTATADSEGQFRIPGVSPGSYMSAAVPADVLAPTDPEFLEAIRSSATALILGEGITPDVELTLLATVGR